MYREIFSHECQIRTYLHTYTHAHKHTHAYEQPWIYLLPLSSYYSRSVFSLFQSLLRQSLPYISCFPWPVTSFGRSLPSVSHCSLSVTTSRLRVSHSPRSITSLCRSIPSVIHFPQSASLLSQSLPFVSNFLRPVTLPSTSHFPRLVFLWPVTSVDSSPPPSPASHFPRSYSLATRHTRDPCTHAITLTLTQRGRTLLVIS